PSLTAFAPSNAQPNPASSKCSFGLDGRKTSDSIYYSPFTIHHLLFTIYHLPSHPCTPDLSAPERSIFPNATKTGTYARSSGGQTSFANTVTGTIRDISFVSIRAK